MFTGCSDDGTSGGAGGDTSTGGYGTGGTPTTGGNGGSATGGSPATGGTAGTTATGGAGAETCTGCARIEVPLDTMDTGTQFQFDVAATDLTDATITYHVMAYAGSGGGLQPYVQNGAAQTYASCGFGWTNLADATGWTDLTLTVNTTNCTGAGWDPTQVVAIGIKISAGAAGPWTNPTIVYVDSIVASGGTATFSHTFDADLEGFAMNTYMPVAGSAVTWLGP
jgi:hypothetical protein